MASFSTYQHCQFSTIISSGSDIYIIGGFSKGSVSKRALVLDFRSQQCRSLPNMRQPRETPAVDVINGKIYVTGGCESSNNNKDWGEVYDPKTNTWEPLLTPTTQDLTVQKSEVPSKFNLVIDGIIYGMDSLKLNNLLNDSCLVEIKINELCLISFMDGKLVWCEQKGDHFLWNRVKGLEGLLHKNLILVPNSAIGRRRVTVWWTSEVEFRRNHWTKECATKIWCAEISFERSNLEVGELCGFVEWSKNVFTFDGILLTGPYIFAFCSYLTLNLIHMGFLFSFQRILDFVEIS